MVGGGQGQAGGNLVEMLLAMLVAEKSAPVLPKGNASGS
jgi:hypothetical protein